MQFKKSRTDRQIDTQTHRAYTGLQVPPFNLTVNVGNDNVELIDYLLNYCFNTIPIYYYFYYLLN